MAVIYNNYRGPVGSYIRIPTHVSPAGGQSTHPSVVDFGGAWNGFRYWMAFTPYPNANDAHEDPNIVASSDGTTWVVPPGLTNPLDNQPGSPGAYNSDTFLYYRASNSTLYIFWRTLDRSLGSNQEKLYYRTSTDGVTWTPKVMMRQATTTSGVMLSPSLYFDGTRWTMYVVDTSTNPATMRRYQSTGDTLTTWGAATDCEVAGIPTGRQPWHPDIMRLGSQWVGTITLSSAGQLGSGSSVHMVTSSNGVDFQLDITPLIPNSGPRHGAIYKASLVPRTDSWGNVDFDVWYGGRVLPNGVWDMFRTRVTHQRDTVPPTAPAITSATVTAGQAGIQLAWSAADDDRGVSRYRIERNGSIVASSTGLSFIDPVVMPGVSVTYRVIAEDAAGNRTASGPHTLIPSSSGSPLPPILDNAAPGSAPEIRLLGQGALAGARANIGDYRVQEDATPIDVMGVGGVGGVSFDAVESPNFRGTPALRRQPFMLYDPLAGVQMGIVDSLSAGEGIVDVQGVSVALSLTANRRVGAFSGSLYQAFTYYFLQGGLSLALTLHPSAQWALARTVNLPPWTGDVWTQVRKLAAIHGLEVAAVGATVVIRPRNLREIFPLNASPVRTEMGAEQAAERVVIEYRRKWAGSNQPIYPIEGSAIPDRPMISVNASETVVENYPVRAYLQSVKQPQQVAEIGPNDSNVTASGAFAVVDKDGRVVTQRDWLNAGGSLSVAIGADGQSVDVTVRGPAITERSPFRIASSSADDEFQYAALYLVGSGIFFEDRELMAYTGAATELAAVDSEVRINEPLVDSDATASAVLIRHAQANAGHRSTISFSTTKVTRRGEVGALVSQTFAEFNVANATATFGSFNTQLAGKKFSDLNKAAYEGRSTEFANQAFGGVAGARVRHGDAYYRIDSASISPSLYELSASQHTLVSDFNAAWAGKKFSDFNTLWAGLPFGTFNMSPLATG